MKHRTEVQVHVRVDHLTGLVTDTESSHLRPEARDEDGPGPSGRYPALYVVGQLCAFGEVLGLPAHAPISVATADGCSWGSILSFPLKVPPAHQPINLGMHASTGRAMCIGSPPRTLLIAPVTAAHGPGTWLEQRGAPLESAKSVMSDHALKNHARRSTATWRTTRSWR